MQNIELHTIFLWIQIEFNQKLNLATDYNSITVPAGCLFVRAVQVFDSTTASTGQGVYLERRDQTFIQEYVGELTGDEGNQSGQDTTGLPKYYSMFGGATGHRINYFWSHIFSSYTRSKL